jgi:hypothetical protein
LPLDVSCYLQKGKLCLIMVDRFCWINACKHAETYFDLWPLAVLVASIDGEVS